MIEYSPASRISHILSQYEVSKKCGKEKKMKVVMITKFSIHQLIKQIIT